MNEYQLKVFEEIRNNQNVFLLNGPSVSKLENQIYQLKDRKIIYWGFNNINGIEKNILSKIEKNIDIYVLFSLEEALLRVDDVIEFLARKDSKLLITTFQFVIQLQALRANCFKNFHKIIIGEEINKGSSFVINSLGSSIEFFLNVVAFKSQLKPLILFGCDGVKMPQEEGDTHAFIETYTKLPRKNHLTMHFGKLKTSSETLYDDMINFDTQSYKYLQKENIVLKTEKLIIYNANLESNYKSFPKISQEEAIEIITKNSEVGQIFIDETPFLEKQTEYFTQLLNICNFQLWRTDYNGHIGYIIDTITQIKVRQEKIDTIIRDFEMWRTDYNGHIAYIIDAITQIKAQQKTIFNKIYNELKRLIKKL